MKRKLRLLNVFFIVFTLILLTACQSDEAEKDNVNSNEETKTIKQKDPETYNVSIAAIGDILIHSPVYKDAQIGNNRYDFTKMFRQVKPYLENTDITVANSESIIGGSEIGLSSYPSFNSPYEVGDTLKAVGVDVVTMANNHTLDRGEKAIINATNYWEKIGVTYVGAARNQEDANKIKTMTKNNIVFSFLGYTYGTNGIPVPKGKEYLVNLIDLEKMKSDIERAKEISDVVIVNLHNGNEYERHFNQEQENVVQSLADFGADIVLAHHPHVLQPTKWYEGKNGNKTFVIHSLGNFLSSQDKLYTRIGAILQLDVKKTIEYDAENNPITSIEVLNPKLLPTFVKYQNKRNFEIYPLYRVTNKDLANSKSVYEEIKNHMSQYMPELQFIEE